MLRKWNLWGYIDGRDGAQAVVRALEANRPGFEAYIIAAADTVMSRPNAELVAGLFPDVPVTRELGEHDTMLRSTRRGACSGTSPSTVGGTEVTTRWSLQRRLVVALVALLALVSVIVVPSAFSRCARACCSDSTSR